MPSAHLARARAVPGPWGDCRARCPAGASRWVEDPDLAAHGLQQPSRLEGEQPAVGALAQGAVEHQEARLVARGFAHARRSGVGESNSSASSAGKNGVVHIVGFQDAAWPASYQPWVRFTTATTASITGTSMRTPTTVASAAPDSKAEEADGRGHRQFEEVARPDQRRGSGHAVLTPSLRLSR